MIRATYLRFLGYSLTREQADSLAAEYAIHNKENGITGAMGFKNGFFVQTLEGDEEPIYELLGKMMADKRYKGIILSEPVEISERFYSGCPMRVVSPSEFKDFRAILEA